MEVLHAPARHCFSQRGEGRAVASPPCSSILSLGSLPHFSTSLRCASGSTEQHRLLERQRALDIAMDDINNTFGKGSVTRLGSAGGALVETFPSGCLTLDIALGGGIPKGRVVEVSRPYKQAEFDIIFGEGICRLGCILDCSEMLKVVVRRGAWYSYGDTRLGQGRERAVQYLRENPYACDSIEKAVRARMSDVYDTNYLESTAFDGSLSDSVEDSSPSLEEAVLTQSSESNS